MNDREMLRWLYMKLRPSRGCRKFELKRKHYAILDLHIAKMNAEQKEETEKVMADLMKRREENGLYDNRKE